MMQRWMPVCLFLLLVSSQAYAGEFRIMPMSLELGRDAKSGTFSVINDGNEKLTCQISVKEWSQDAKGQDVYTDTSDIVFFPKLMTVEPNEQRVIRVGMKGAPSAREKTYRLFLEELPEPKKRTGENLPGKMGAAVTIAFRFSTPIFYKPAREQMSGTIETLELSKGTARAVVKNTGNVHIKVPALTIQGKDAKGQTVFSQEVAGWYVLQGLSRSFDVSIPQDVCVKIATIDARAEMEGLSLHKTLSVTKEMCGR